jgi:ubiquinol-cytochrome c reductase cytochrome b subunit
MSLTFYGVLWANGGNDVIAETFHLSINAITWTARIALFVAPPIAFVIAKRICLALQRRDREKVLHGRETGIVMRTPDGEFYEVHEPVSPAEAYVLTQHDSYRPLALEADVDENGVPNPKSRSQKIRARLTNFYFGDAIEPATPREVRELEAAHSGGEH